MDEQSDTKAFPQLWQYPQAPVELSLNQKDRKKETKHGIKIFPRCHISFSDAVAYSGIRNLEVPKKN